MKYLKQSALGLFAFLILVFMTGCFNRSTLVEVNLPVAEITELERQTDEAAVVNRQLPVTGQLPAADNTIAPTPVRVEIPARLELAVDFAPQAPFANWDELHEEACEEASIITAAKYFNNQPLNEQIMDEEIYRLDRWERERGYKIDLSAAQTAAVLRDYYNLNAKVVEEVTVDRIKYELARGNLVIVPAAGRELDNPYFRSPGPIYHMLVIKGYDNDEFITNEVGTKRGDGFRYKYQQLLDAVHDWEPTWSHYEVTAGQISSQPARMVVVNKAE